VRRLADRIEPAWISDHLCWTGVEGRNVHDLLPLPYTEEALALVAARVGEVQEALGQRILLENVSSYLTFKTSEMHEWEFLTEVAERADCDILLDINNIYVSSVNHGFDPSRYLRAVPGSACVSSIWRVTATWADISSIHTIIRSRRPSGRSIARRLRTSDACPP